VSDPDDPDAVATAIGSLLDDPGLASRQGQAARRRAERAFSYDLLAERLGEALSGVEQRP
jgi:glycosyltransferase involved in cell wall biosynthesis